MITAFQKHIETMFLRCGHHIAKYDRHTALQQLFEWAGAHLTGTFAMRREYYDSPSLHRRRAARARRAAPHHGGGGSLGDDRGGHQAVARRLDHALPLARLRPPGGRRAVAGAVQRRCPRPRLVVDRAARRAVDRRVRGAGRDLPAGSVPGLRAAGPRAYCARGNLSAAAAGRRRIGPAPSADAIVLDARHADLGNCGAGAGCRW